MPAIPWTRSRPPPGSSVSFPARPNRISPAAVPFRTSLLFVPRITLAAAPASTVTVNTSDTLNSPSEATTFTSQVPAAPGLPLKVRLAASKLSQEGSAEPSARLALYESSSPSGSLKAPAAST